MKKLTDEEIQALLEQGLHTTNLNNEDEKLYSILFKELSNSSPFQLADHVGEQVIQQLEKQQIKTENRRYNRSVVVIVVTSLMFIVMAVPFFSPQVPILLWNHIDIIIFLSLALIAVEITDRFLIKKRLSNQME